MFLVSLSIATTFDSGNGLNALVENQDAFATIRISLDEFNADLSQLFNPVIPLPTTAPPGGLRVYVDSDVPNLLDRFDLSSFTSDPEFFNSDVTSFTPNSDNSGFAITINEGVTSGGFNLRLLDNVESDPNLLEETLDGLTNATFTLISQQDVPADENQITGISDYIPFPFANDLPFLLADDASQLPSVEPSEPLDPAPTIEVGISISTDFDKDVAALVEDQSSTAIVRIDLSEPAPAGGLGLYLETGIPQSLDRLALLNILLNPQLENINVGSFGTDFDDSGFKVAIDEGATFGTFLVSVADNAESDVPLAILDGLRAVPITLRTANDVTPENEDVIGVDVSDYAIDPNASSSFLFFADTASQVFGQEGEDFFIGTRQKDLFTGKSADEEIYGLGGNDRLQGNQGDDKIFGGDGNDRLWGDMASRIKAGGDDTINGGAGDDVIRGGGGDDILFGNAGADYIRGDEGDDLIRGGGGDDRLRGDFSRQSDGKDTFILSVMEGTDTIEDFGIGEDFIGLADGLSFEQLLITQLPGRRTLIEVADETLAILNNVNANDLIASADTTFTLV